MLDGNDIADYAQKLYESWGIGRKGKDNGILVLVADKEHKPPASRPATAWKAPCPTPWPSALSATRWCPPSGKMHYYAGLDRATDQLISLAKGEYKADPNDARNQGGSSGSSIGFWIIIGALILIFLLRSRGGGGVGRGAAASAAASCRPSSSVIFRGVGASSAAAAVALAAAGVAASAGLAEVAAAAVAPAAVGNFI
ncbi:MAG: TPM domain-containing protein [Hymenobacter sp.]